MKTTFHKNCLALLNIHVKTLKFSFQLDQPFRGEEILQKIDGAVLFVDFCRYYGYQWAAMKIWLSTGQPCSQHLYPGLEGPGNEIDQRGGRLMNFYYSSFLILWLFLLFCSIY